MGLTLPDFILILLFCRCDRGSLSHGQGTWAQAVKLGFHPKVISELSGIPYIGCMTLRSVLLAAIAFALPSLVWAQLDPEGVQVVSYFPQIADGGSAAQNWTTSFTLVNPHGSISANAILFVYGSDGKPLPLDFGSGPTSQVTFTIAPQGTATFTSSGAASDVRTGWAMVASSLPLEGVAQYRYSVKGVPQQGVSVGSTAASMHFASPATITTGIAVANPYTNPVPLTISVLDSHGTVLASSGLTLAALSHQSFNLNQIFPSLGSSFRGSVQITGNTTQTFFVALVLSGDAGVISSLPPSGLAWPAAQYERIYKVWMKVLNAALNFPMASLGKVPTLVIDGNKQVINSYACGWTWSTPAFSCSSADLNSVHIFMNVAELMSDSDGELGFIIAHELGHIIQAHASAVASPRGPSYLVFIPQDLEWDADLWGLVLSMEAGYDPYSGTGALGRVYTVTTSGTTGLLAANFDGITGDVHGSLLQRLGVLWGSLEAACTASADMQNTCNSYKAIFHPHFPGSAPLEKRPGGQ